MKTWKADDYYESHVESNDTFDYRVSEKCKFCGFTFPEMQTCGTFQIGENERQQREHEQDKIKHLMDYHLTEIQESLKGDNNCVK